MRIKNNLLLAFESSVYLNVSTVNESSVYLNVSTVNINRGLGMLMKSQCSISLNSFLSRQNLGRLYWG